MSNYPFGMNDFIDDFRKILIYLVRKGKVSSDLSVIFDRLVDGDELEVCVGTSYEDFMDTINQQGEE